MSKTCCIFAAKLKPTHMKQSDIFTLFATLKLRTEKAMRNKESASSLYITYQKNGLTPLDIADEGVRAIAIVNLMVQTIDAEHYEAKPNDFKAIELYAAVCEKCDKIAKVLASPSDWDAYKALTA
jgi:hypothetical protein